MLILLIISPLIVSAKNIKLPMFSEGSYDYIDSVEQLDNTVENFIRDVQTTNRRVERQAGYEYERPSLSFDLPVQQSATSGPVTQLSVTSTVSPLQQQQYYAYPMPQQPSVLISGSQQTAPGFPSISTVGNSIDTSPSTPSTFKPSTNAPVYLPPSVSSQSFPGISSGSVFSTSTSRPSSQNPTEVYPSSTTPVIQPSNPTSNPSANYLPPNPRPTTELTYGPSTTRPSDGTSTTTSNYGYSSTQSSSSATASAVPSLYRPPSTSGTIISSQGPTASISTPAPTYLPPFKK